MTEKLSNFQKLKAHLLLMDDSISYSAKQYLKKILEEDKNAK